MPQSRDDLHQTVERIRAWQDSLTPGPLGDPKADDLRRIAAAVLASAGDEIELNEAVQAARENGRTWTEVAAILGITRQSASTRFGTLRVIFVDPARGLARWQHISGVDHERPPLQLSHMSVGVSDAEYPRPGLYQQNGEQRDGRWVYLPTF